MDKNVEFEESVKEDTEDPVPAKPKKPSVFQKLKNKRWTFKVKNNLTKYLTVEPLLCFYLQMIFMTSLTVSYEFHKACLSVDEDVNFCDIISNYGTPNQKCIDNDYMDIYCKDTKENENATKISCEKPKSRIDFISVRPEDYRICLLAEKTYNKLEADGTETSIGIFAVALQFFVIMIVSIWSDKHNKRKVCLLLPLFGQLIIGIINLHGAFYSTLSFETIQVAVTVTDSLSGGMALFLFGSFSYMIDEEICRNLLFRFGIITGILTAYRYTPLYQSGHKYYNDDKAYKNLISFSLAFNIICLLYVKIVLNEVKVHKNGIEPDDSSIDAISDPQQKDEVNAHKNGVEPENGSLDATSDSQQNDEVKAHRNGTEPDNSSIDSQQNVDPEIKPSTTTKLKRYSGKITKALNLDILWDYVRIIFRKRSKPGRIIIILYFVVVFTKSITPLDERIVLLDVHSDPDTGTYTYKFLADVVDVEGVIFVLSSILIKLCKVSNVTVSLLTICVPVAARGVLVLLSTFIESVNYYQLENGTDFYSPLKRIASCSLLLAFVDRNEARIFVIVQAIAFLPQFIIISITSNKEAELSDVLPEISDESKMIIIMLLCTVVFVGSGFIYYIFKKNKRSKNGHICENVKNEISLKPLVVPQEVNFSEDSGPSCMDSVSPAPAPIYTSNNGNGSSQIDTHM